MLRLLNKALDYLAMTSFVLSTVMIVALGAVGAYDAFSDAVLNHPIALAQELSQVILAMLFFLMLPLSQMRRQHITVDVLVPYMSPRVAWFCEKVGVAIAAVFLALVAWRMWVYAGTSYRMNETATALVRFPIYPAKFVCALGATVAALEAVRQLFARRIEAAQPQGGVI